MIDETPEGYCRALETYLCRKNDGHLIRIVGPAFEQVCGWALRGVPLKVAQRGIDRYFERYYAKGPRRRPVRVEFCEADVLDVFDEWRRAVGLGSVGSRGSVGSGGSGSSGGSGGSGSSGGSGGSGGSVGSGGAEGAQGSLDSDNAEPNEGAGRRQPSLPAHLDRAIARLTALRGGENRSLDPVLEAIVRELDAARLGAKSLRGEARAAFVERLRTLDEALVAAAREQCDAPTLQRLGSEADAELAPFRDRMPRDAFEQSRRACIDRLIRERARLPVIAYD